MSLDAMAGARIRQAGASLRPLPIRKRAGGPGPVPDRIDDESGRRRSPNRSKARARRREPAVHVVDVTASVPVTVERARRALEPACDRFMPVGGAFAALRGQVGRNPRIASCAFVGSNQRPGAGTPATGRAKLVTLDDPVTHPAERWR